MAVLLYPNPIKDKGFAVTRQAARLLREYGETVLAAESCRADLCGEEITFLPEEGAFAQADQVVTIGGDGTLLRACTPCLRLQKPVLGVNLGRTGFLATCEVGEMSQKLARLAKGDFTVEHRSLLHGKAQDGSWQADALNDIVLYGSSRLHPMDYTVFCDGSFVCRYRSDGVIFATPTGSTAYALSAGGPILDVSAQAFVMHGICAHGIHMPPIVFSAGRSITVVAEAENRDDVYICADSHARCAVRAGGRVEISTTGRLLDLISFGTAEQFEAIDSKLMRR